MGDPKRPKTGAPAQQPLPLTQPSTQDAAVQRLNQSLNETSWGLKKKIVSITLGNDSLLTALCHDKQTQIVFGRIASIESGLPVIQLRLNMIKSKSEPHYFSHRRFNAMTACKVLVHMYESGQATSGKVNDDIAKALESLKDDEQELKEEQDMAKLEDEAFKLVTSSTCYIDGALSQPDGAYEYCTTVHLHRAFRRVCSDDFQILTKKPLIKEQPNIGQVVAKQLELVEFVKRFSRGRLDYAYQAIFQHNPCGEVQFVVWVLKETVRLMEKIPEYEVMIDWAKMRALPLDATLEDVLLLPIEDALARVTSDETRMLNNARSIEQRRKARDDAMKKRLNMIQDAFENPKKLAWPDPTPFASWARRLEGPPKAPALTDNSVRARTAPPVHGVDHNHTVRCRTQTLADKFANAIETTTREYHALGEASGSESYKTAHAAVPLRFESWDQSVHDEWTARATKRVEALGLKVPRRPDGEVDTSGLADIEKMSPPNGTGGHINDPEPDRPKVLWFRWRNCFKSLCEQNNFDYKSDPQMVNCGTHTHAFLRQYNLAFEGPMGPYQDNGFVIGVTEAPKMATDDGCYGLPSGYCLGVSALTPFCFTPARSCARPCTRAQRSPFESYLNECAIAYYSADAEGKEGTKVREEGEKAYAGKLKDTFGLQASETDHVPLHELKASLEAFCKQRNEEAPSLTRELLGQFNMNLLQHKGKLVVTGLRKPEPAAEKAAKAKKEAAKAAAKAEEEGSGGDKDSGGDEGEGGGEGSGGDEGGEKRQRS